MSADAQFLVWALMTRVDHSECLKCSNIEDVAAVAPWYRWLVVTNEVTYLNQRLPTGPRERRARGVSELRLLLEDLYGQLQQEHLYRSEEGELMFGISRPATILERALTRLASRAAPGTNWDTDLWLCSNTRIASLTS